MSSNERVWSLRATMATVVLMACAGGARATTVEDISAQNLRIKALEGRLTEARLQKELDKLTSSQTSSDGSKTDAAPKGLVPDRTIDDGVSLLSVTGPSSNPTYLIQYRGVPMPMKIGGDAMDGWQLEAVHGNNLVLVRKVGKKQRVAERKTVTMVDLSYASQREQQRIDAAKMAASQPIMPGSMMAPMPPGAMGAPAQDQKGPTP